ncbi:MAG: type II secretion system GspH family protein [Planctomycetaceae bacterium]|jgi:prepilin-type N-terminal cleavage/methylation domain-containing protein|nr:type II secretion system GspH family protein [Planctomycetaceae bacterium]
MTCKHEQLRFSANRRAFTLVELLMVCVIIALLAVLTLIMVNKATNSSKAAKTRATIQKIDTAIQQIFESYEDKLSNIVKKVTQDYHGLVKEDQHKVSLHIIRDIMRMEMPQNWAEVNDPPLETESIGGNKYKADPSPLLVYYKNAEAGVPAGKTHGRAALLFLIIQNLNPEALEAFHGSEVADTDGDGLLEFVDAWGKPIQFLRWAPAFTDSDLQQNVLALCEPKYVPEKDIEKNREWWGTWETRKPLLQQAMVQASINHPDVLDEDVNIIGWFLYPLVYSAGPDGQYGLDDGETIAPTVGENGTIDPYAFPFGMPNGSSHFDNIHNHQWYRSF